MTYAIRRHKPDFSRLDSNLATLEELLREAETGLIELSKWEQDIARVRESGGMNGQAPARYGHLANSIGQRSI